MRPSAPAPAPSTRPNPTSKLSGVKTIPKPASHTATLRLTVRLKEGAGDCTHGRGGHELCLLFSYLLSEGVGSGLRVGPDCDGYLNLGGMGEGQAPAGWGPPLLVLQGLLTCMVMTECVAYKIGERR